MFGIRSVGKAISSLGDALSKFNQTIHGSADSAAKTVEHIKSGASPSYITRKIPMPSYPSQDALVYIDTSTRGCVFFHVDNGKLWSVGKLSSLELNAILNNINFENLN